MFDRLITAFQKFIFCYNITADMSSFLRLIYNTKKYRRFKAQLPGGFDAEQPIVYHLRLNRKTRNVFLRTYAGDLDIFYEVFWKKIYELPWKHETAFEAKSIVDLGANTGLASLFFSNCYSSATVSAVEADHNNVNLLTANLSREILSHRVEALHAAVHSEDIALYVQTQQKAYNQTVSRKVTEMPVRGISMNTFCDLFELKNIDLLKIDIEGSEEFLFSGNTEWLNRVKMLVVEIHTTSFRPVCESILRSRGFIIEASSETDLRQGLIWARKESLSEAAIS